MTCGSEFYRPSGVLNSAAVSERRRPVPSSPAASPPQRVLSNSLARRRSVKPTSKGWQPPEGLSPEDVPAIIRAVASERDRLLLTTLWATGARISEVLVLRPRDVRRKGLVLPNLKKPSRRTKTAHLSPAHASLPGDLLLWAREGGLTDDSRCFSLVSGCETADVSQSIACVPGRSSGPLQNGRKSRFWLCERQATGGRASQRRSIHTCFGTPVCVRWCGT